MPPQQPPERVRRQILTSEGDADAVLAEAVERTRAEPRQCDVGGAAPAGALGLDQHAALREPAVLAARRREPEVEIAGQPLRLLERDERDAPVVRGQTR